MKFELTEEQKMVRDMVRRFAEEELKPKAAEMEEKEEKNNDPEKLLEQL